MKLSAVIEMSEALSDEGLEVLPDSEHIDLRGLEGTCCYCSREAEDSIRETLKDVGPRGIHWIDTGDYHYLTLFFLEKIREPFTLVLLDNHPDDQPSAFDEGMLSCGSWICQARNLTSKIVSFGPDGAVPLPSDIPEGPVYISLDKDCLSRCFYRTDWSQGEMSLDNLEEILRAVALSHRIIGVDLCGGITYEKGATAADLEVNRRSDAAILEILSRL